MWKLPEVIWQYMEPLIPEKIGVTEKGGRPPLPPKKIANGIFYILATGCQWKAAPKEFGSGSSLHKYFQEWERAGVFISLWQMGLLEYDNKKGIKWQWQSIDSSTVKAPLGGEKNGPKPYGSWEKGYKAFYNNRCSGSSSFASCRKSKSSR